MESKREAWRKHRQWQSIVNGIGARPPSVSETAPPPRSALDRALSFFSSSLSPERVDEIRDPPGTGLVSQSPRFSRGGPVPRKQEGGGGSEGSRCTLPLGPRSQLTRGGGDRRPGDAWSRRRGLSAWTGPLRWLVVAASFSLRPIHLALLALKRVADDGSASRPRRRRCGPGGKAAAL